MASILRQEIGANFLAFDKDWPGDMANARAALAACSETFEQSYLRISTIQAWRTSIILGNVGEGAEAFFFEAQNDFLTSHCLARCGSFRQSLKALRSAIENVLFALYYMDHPVELEKWEHGRHKVGFTELCSYFEAHPALFGKTQPLSAIDAIKAEYATLSKAVHGSAKIFRMTQNLTDIRLWGSDAPTVGKWATREKAVIQNFNLLLLYLFCTSIQGAQKRDLREVVALIVPKAKWTTIKSEINVTLVG